MTDPLSRPTLGSSKPAAQSPRGEGQVGRHGVPYAKARRYVGLLIALAFVTFMFWQDGRYPKGASNFINRTILTRLIEMGDRGEFVRSMLEYEAKCTDAEKKVNSVDRPQDRIEAIRWANFACDLRMVLPLEQSFVSRVSQREPAYIELALEYRDLSERTSAEQGLANGSPSMTPELRERGKHLLRVLIDQGNADAVWIARMKLAMHALVLLAGVVGVMYRQALGSIAFAPLGWLFGLGRSGARAAQEIHKKI